MHDRMQSLISMIRTWPYVSLIIAIALFLTTAMIMRTSGNCLKTLHAPIGIISFELAFTGEHTSEIKKEWDSTICFYGTITSAAKRNIYQDFLFIPAYTFLLIVLVVISGASKNQPELHKVSLRFINLALIAGGCDVVENTIMLFYLNDYNLSPILFGIFAAIKFIFILLIIAYVIWSFIAKVFRNLAERITKSA